MNKKYEQDQFFLQILWPVGFFHKMGGGKHGNYEILKIDSVRKSSGENKVVPEFSLNVPKNSYKAF